ncbi:hypothetical protein HA402_010783 [Bradysia odoriphaga]|nr:hypothetical protein HA402_010783 [Bradysia odoriphaga]
MPTITDLFHGLADNNFFTAGFGLFTVGAGATVLRKGFQGALILFRRNYMITLEVPCRDKSYQWLLQWITKNGAPNTQHMSVETSFEQKDSGDVKTKFEFIPSVGTHIMWYKNTWIRVDRTREKSTVDIQMGIPFETVQLTSFGRNKKIYSDILEEAGKLALKDTEGKTLMYTAMGSEWRLFGQPRKRRPLSSVVLDNGISQKIMDDCSEFSKKETCTWYSERGIPYRRGYLLHGPPGCGKSSFITALAGELEFSICILNLSERGLTDDRLNHLLNVAPEKSIILLEDIDAAFASRDETSVQKAAFDGLNRVTFSGLLNCLDGVASTEARIVFMTTNHIERLDKALIRPGRIDFKQEIKCCSQHQIEEMFKRFYGTASSVRDSVEFAQKVMSFGRDVSPAEIQGYFMIHKKSALDKMIREADQIWDDSRKDDKPKVIEKV